jgi:hypothetical protein
VAARDAVGHALVHVARPGGGRRWHRPVGLGVSYAEHPRMQRAASRTPCNVDTTYNARMVLGIPHAAAGSGLFGNAVGSVTAQTQCRPHTWHVARSICLHLAPDTPWAGTQRRTCTATPTARTWPRRRGCKSSPRRARPPTSLAETRCLSTASAWRTTCAATTRARAPPARINARFGQLT